MSAMKSKSSILQWNTHVKDLHLTSLAESSAFLQDVKVSNCERSAFQTNLSAIVAMFPVLQEALIDQTSCEEFSVILCDVSSLTLKLLSKLIHSGSVTVEDDRDVGNVQEVLIRLGMLDVGSSRSQWWLECVASENIKCEPELVIKVENIQMDEVCNAGFSEEDTEDQKMSGVITQPDETEAEIKPEATNGPVQKKTTRKKRTVTKKNGGPARQPEPEIDPDSPFQFRLPKRKRQTVGRNEETCLKCSLVVSVSYSREHKHIHALGKERFGLYACTICDDVSRSKREAERHRDWHKKTYKGEKWKCQNCEFETSAVAVKTISAHERNCKKGGQTFVCDVCGQTFIIEQELKNHRYRKHLEDPQTCSLCGLTVKNKYSLKRHNECRHPKVSTCIHCGKEVKEQSMKRHIFAFHTEDLAKPFRCNICGKGLSSKKHLKDHLDIHENLRRHKCQFCRYDSNNRSNLLKHVREVHKKEDD